MESLKLTSSNEEMLKQIFKEQFGVEVLSIFSPELDSKTEPKVITIEMLVK